MELPKEYNAQEAEQKWQKYWQENNIYRFDPKSKKPVYSIDVPPPYASAGHLHIGHALHYTQFEIIARYKRMQGFNVYFAPCFDNNGLPTEKYVEETYNISKSSTTREEFRKLCAKESAKVEKEYADRVFRRLGHSYDWSLLYTTIDPEAQKVAQMSFLDLYEKKFCYRAEEPTLWCTNHQTALAQAEVEDLERTTTLNYINFDTETGDKITIATTRPEFIPACVAIFYNPKDKRYAGLKNKRAIVPLIDENVPILTDDKVDKDFGTGLVMVCTFGDTTDIEWWRKHKLPLKAILTKEGKLQNAGKYTGLMLSEARSKILLDLEDHRRIVKREQLKQTIGSCWRCSTPIEYIVTKQWFIKTLDFKKQLIQQGKKINWYPDFYRIRYEDWTKNLAWDWCISRQRFYGVPIPVWYCDKCNAVILPDKKELPVDPTATYPKIKCNNCGSDTFSPDEDVFDTWMTSSLTPQIALRWLENPSQYNSLFPMSLRPQSHDIIRTWAFYTILKSYLHFKSIPWKDIVIGTFVLDPNGRGMHKSKGNAIWIHELLDKYNVDVVRYWVGTATFGEDVPYQEKDLITGNRFIIKLWNASRLVLSHLEQLDDKKPKLEIMDAWLLSKLNKVIKEATQKLDEYKVGEAKKIVEQFFWNDLTSNYLEIVKDRLYNPQIRGQQAKKSAQYALYNTLLTMLKLFSPITPHITEEIYQSFFAERESFKSIHISPWPAVNKALIDKQIEEHGDRIVDMIAKVRQYKTMNKKSMKEPIVLTIDVKKYKDALEDIRAATGAKDIKDGSFNIAF